jgi:3-deoxy-D-manno-octulosonate 8-phosphate phosphatase (KDO 8-P phosphatase)
MNVLAKFALIKAFVFDMDGVLTDGSLLAMPGGAMVRKFNIKDGFALQLAVKKGYKIAIISGGTSAEAIERFNKLGITDVFMKADDKLAVLQSWMHQNNLQPQEVLFMGDDLPDEAPMQWVGLPTCPADAVPEIYALAQYITAVPGGGGSAREVIEKALRIQDNWGNLPFVKAQ